MLIKVKGVIASVVLFIVEMVRTYICGYEEENNFAHVGTPIGGLMNQYGIILSMWESGWQDPTTNAGEHYWCDLYGLTNAARLEALYRCGRACSDEERRVVNDVLKSLTNMQGKIEDILDNYGLTTLKTGRGTQSDNDARLLRYITAKYVYTSKKETGNMVESLFKN